MRKILSYRLLFITLPFFLNSGQCQSEGFAYAVTSINNGTNEWIALRKLDISTGKLSNMILNLYDPNQSSRAITVAATITPPPNSGVAAIAYDRKNNRLFYVPMNNDQLRYIDLATMASFPVEDGSFSKAGHYVFQTVSPITRLVIAPDDCGYTVTTDGNHLIRFTTQRTPALTDLGTLVDDAHNNEMSIYNTCANAGGDLVADDAGNLYLITAANRVFKIDIKTRITTFLATISGLPSQFTTNGAAVDENGKIIVCSSIYKDGYFIVDPKTWKALPPAVNQTFYNCSDLANSNVLHTNNSISSAIFIKKLLSKSSNIKIFPNPVLYDEVNVQFSQLPPGIYTIQLANVFGNKVMEQKVKITNHTQTEIIHLSGLLSQAFYYVCILNEKNVVISIDKLAVERW